MPSDWNLQLLRLCSAEYRFHGRLVFLPNLLQLWLIIMKIISHSCIQLHMHFDLIVTMVTAWNLWSVFFRIHLITLNSLIYLHWLLIGYWLLWCLHLKKLYQYLLRVALEFIDCYYKNIGRKQVYSFNRCLSWWEIGINFKDVVESMMLLHTF